MKLIVGLGNPGREYAATRHNVGWWAVDHLADAWGFDGWKKDGQARVASGRVHDQPVRLLKPQTFMNLSGGALIQYARRPSWNPSTDLLVIVDEVALPVGRIRLRATGSAGGHNGLKSVEATLGTRDYARLRIGIKPTLPEHEIGDLSDFVLAPFGRSDAETINALLARVRETAEIWLRDGIVMAMNVANRSEDRRAKKKNEDENDNENENENEGEDEVEVE